MANLRFTTEDAVAMNEPVPLIGKRIFQITEFRRRYSTVSGTIWLSSTWDAQIPAQERAK